MPQLNIKDAETVGLARDLASRSGRSITAVIREALRKEADDRRAAAEHKVREIKAMLEGVQDMWHEEWRGKTSKEIMDSIYDEDGLPL